MSGRDELDIDALRAVAEAATPGDWHWAGNTDTGEPYLAAWERGIGRTSVLAVGWEARSTTGRAADAVREFALDSDLDPDEAVEDWATDRYGEPIPEPRLWFYEDHMAVAARDHVQYEVAPDATHREDQRVYRADLNDVRLPDAQFMAAFSPATVLALLDEVERLRACVDRSLAHWTPCASPDCLTLAVPCEDGVTHCERHPCRRCVLDRSHERGE